jgi:hypothetical protein
VNDPFGEDAALESLVDSLEESGVFDEATRVNQAGLETNPEWSRHEWTHLATIMEAWAYGVLSSDPWHRGFQLVENFEVVFNHVSARLQSHFAAPENQERVSGFAEVVEISLVEVKQWLGQWAAECPEFLAWNERGGSGISHRYSQTPDVPQFIDLDVPSHNAALFLRERRRHEKAFDRRHPLKEDGEA